MSALGSLAAAMGVLGYAPESRGRKGVLGSAPASQLDPSAGAAGAAAPLPPSVEQGRADGRLGNESQLLGRREGCASATPNREHSVRRLLATKGAVR